MRDCAIGLGVTLAGVALFIFGLAVQLTFWGGLIFFAFWCVKHFFG